jgi:hypothetical protein
MQVGSRVICINDKFEPWITKFYISLPKKDEIYVVRHVTLGISIKGEEGEVAICLRGLHNPKSNVSPFQERAFNAERFRELEPPPVIADEEETEMADERELVEI